MRLKRELLRLHGEKKSAGALGCWSIGKDEAGRKADDKGLGTESVKRICGNSAKV